jgi:abequosyltransferase
MIPMSEEKLLSILIPTYNRSKDLKKNIDLLKSILNKSDFKNDIEVLISDNRSEDNTHAMLTGMEFSGLNFRLFRQDKNMGPIYNCLFLLKNAAGIYFMYLGDDDYLDENYLNKVLPVINSDRSIYTVIPATKSLFSSGKIQTGRDYFKKSRFYKPGFGNCLENSWRGTQLSATIHLRGDLYNIYNEQQVDNLYPYVFFIGVNCLHGRTWHMTENPVTVTQMDAAVVKLDYGSANLIPEIYDNYKKLPGISLFHRSRLELKLLKEQPSRYLEYLKLKGIGGLIGCMQALFRDNSTTQLTKILLPFMILRELTIRVFREMLKPFGYNNRPVPLNDIP